MDSYVYRYIDSDLTDFVNIYPYTSVLEVNCYAYLSLDLLNSLGSVINSQQAIDFIWSCYNPEEGGFIGQPFSPDLHPFFKVATAEYTYFAVETLNTLGYSWSSTEIDHIVDFVESLQSITSGGFYNNFSGNDAIYNFKTDLLYSYYCLKTLQTFGYEGSIHIGLFHTFLEGLYDNIENYFRISNIITYSEYCEIIGTILGFQTAEITEYTNYDRNGVVTFLLDNKNSWGIWDNSRAYPYHELIDTFQVIRGLNETGGINQISLSNKEQNVFISLWGT